MAHRHTIRLAAKFFKSRLLTLFQSPIRRHFYIGDHFVKGSSSELQLSNPVPLADRKYLTCSDTAGFPKYLSGPREDYPLLLKAKNSQATTITNWAKRSRQVLDEAFKNYKENGVAVAIIFRGLPITNEKDYSDWVTGLGYDPFTYIGTANRDYIAENVVSGAADHKEYTISLHNDMAYSSNYPRILAMCTFETAAWGGETAICDVREILAKLDAEIVAECERKLIRYWHAIPDENSKDEIMYMSWQQQFKTQHKEIVEEYLNTNGYNFEWDGTMLLYWNNLGPFTTHPLSGERLWFNQMSFHNYLYYHQYHPLFEGVNWPPRRYRCHTTFGDGSAIKREINDEIRRVSWESAVGFQWQDGDVLFIDQITLQHSRLGYQGNRKVGISVLTY